MTTTWLFQLTKEDWRWISRVYESSTLEIDSRFLRATEKKSSWGVRLQCSKSERSFDLRMNSSQVLTESEDTMRTFLKVHSQRVCIPSLSLDTAWCQLSTVLLQLRALNILKWLKCSIFLKTSIEVSNNKQRNFTLRVSRQGKMEITKMPFCFIQRLFKFFLFISRLFLTEDLHTTSLENLIKQYQTIHERLSLMIRILLLITTEESHTIEKEILKMQSKVLQQRLN